MTSNRRFFTSTSVLAGHPDKLCDRISDALVDAHLSLDRQARVRADVAVAGQVVFLVTDIASQGDVDVTGLVRRTISDTGYFPKDMDAERCAILAQSNVRRPPAEGHGRGGTKDRGAAEQTTVFGYACSETTEWMPLPILAAHKFSTQISELSRKHAVAGLGPDGDVQVTVEYDGSRPARIDTLVLQLQFLGNPQKLKDPLLSQALTPVFDSLEVKPDRATRVIINPEGPLEAGGPARVAGLTGRKPADDTYGGSARHGGHAMSGKDPSRLDRSAAYAARHAAVNVVAAGLATECEIMLSYAIGELKPTTIDIRTFGTGKVPDVRLSEIVGEVFDLRPSTIEERLRLRSLPGQQGGIFYQRLASGGHFGRRDMDLPWEQADTVEVVRAAAGEANVGSPG